VHGCKFFLPLLLREPEAHIVNISSVFGLLGVPGQATYCASKFAVRGFTESLRQELHGTSVRVTCVHPGGVRTSIAANGRSGTNAPPGLSEQLQKKFDRLARTPAPRAAQAILNGVLNNKPRVLIGSDAFQLDLWQRILPNATDRILRARMQ
jgi:short-subunit dehydrogenase